eukprot:707501-Pyramimonas_sp.AAC.1
MSPTGRASPPARHAMSSFAIRPDTSPASTASTTCPPCQHSQIKSQSQSQSQMSSFAIRPDTSPASTASTTCPRVHHSLTDGLTD